MVDQPEAADAAEAQLEELDYRITFPSPTGKDYSDEESDEAEGDGAEQPEPVVILLGWLGCQEKHLAKYAAIWDHKSCITIQYTLPGENIFKNSCLLPTATKILELIVDLNLEENPLFFHVFSNGGSFLYKHIIDVLHSDPQFGKLCVAGTIFDSSPAPADPSTGAKAVMSWHPSMNILLRYTMGFMFMATYFSAWMYQKALSLFGVTYKLPHSDFWDAMKSDPSRWPQMYLFSKSDSIVRETDIREMATHRRSLGVDVLEQCWDDSEHVLHFLVHPEPYTKECYYFLELCLNRL